MFRVEPKQSRLHCMYLCMYKLVYVRTCACMNFIQSSTYMVLLIALYIMIYCMDKCISTTYVYVYVFSHSSLLLTRGQTLWSIISSTTNIWTLYRYCVYYLTVHVSVCNCSRYYHVMMCTLM